jgi:hypothetical protein
MNAQERGHEILKSLSTPEARREWSQDPAQYLVANGFANDLPEDAKAQLGNYMSSIELPPLVEPGQLGADWWSCIGCKLGIGATVFGIAAAVIAAIVACTAGTGGAAAPAEIAAAPELAEGAAGAAAGVVAVETGLTLARVLQIFAAAFVTYGVAGFAEGVIEELCKATGACDG